MHGSTRSHYAREPVGSHVTTGRLRPASPVPRPALAVTYWPSGQGGPSVAFRLGQGLGRSVVSAPAQRVRAHQSYRVAGSAGPRCSQVSTPRRVRRFPADIRVSVPPIALRRCTLARVGKRYFTHLLPEPPPGANPAQPVGSPSTTPSAWPTRPVSFGPVRRVDPLTSVSSRLMRGKVVEGRYALRRRALHRVRPRPRACRARAAPGRPASASESRPAIRRDPRETDSVGAPAKGAARSRREETREDVACPSHDTVTR